MIVDLVAHVSQRELGVTHATSAPQRLVEDWTVLIASRSRLSASKDQAPIRRPLRRLRRSNRKVRSVLRVQ
jgi:hypothetical protein